MDLAPSNKRAANLAACTLNESMASLVPLIWSRVPEGEREWTLTKVISALNHPEVQASLQDAERRAVESAQTAAAQRGKR